MLTLDEILAAVDQLSPQEREQVSQHIQAYQPQTLHRTPQEIAQRVAQLDASLEHFWEDIPSDEVEEIVKAMNE